MESTFVFFDITKLLICGEEMLISAELNRCVNSFLCFFGPSLHKVKPCQISSLQNVCDRIFGGKHFCPFHL